MSVAALSGGFLAFNSDLASGRILPRVVWPTKPSLTVSKGQQLASLLTSTLDNRRQRRPSGIHLLPCTTPLPGHCRDRANKGDSGRVTEEPRLLADGRVLPCGLQTRLLMPV